MFNCRYKVKWGIVQRDGKDGFTGCQRILWYALPIHLGYKHKERLEKL